MYLGDELRSLYQDTAQYLTGGRPVWVRYRQPRSIGAKGSASRSNKGFDVIDLWECENPYDELYVFLHEVGHLIFSFLEPSESYLKPSASKVVDYDTVEYKEGWSETLADYFADRLFRWSFDRLMEQKDPFSQSIEKSVMRMLRDLKTYPIEEDKKSWRV